MLLAGITSIGAREALTSVRSQGTGATKGTAVTHSETNAGTDFKGAVDASLTRQGLKVAEIQKRVAERATIKQKASSSGQGAYKFNNLAANEVRRFVKGDKTASFLVSS